MAIPIPKVVLDKIDRWAKKYNKKAKKVEDVKIKQIWYNDNDLSERGKTLFIVTECKYSDGLEEAINNIDLEIFNAHGFSLNFQTCPVISVKNLGLKEKVFDYTT